MCRIVGIVDFKKCLGEALEHIVNAMRDSLSHGGPDDFGTYIDHHNGVALGHRRLSIIDLSSLGHQPMSNYDKNIWITYNGEIYNFQELRNELTDYGYGFKSRTDTEVLIYGYEKWGIEELLERLRGMFAFAIYDRRTKPWKLILAKDRFGIKPLYYYKDNEKFIFASEVKAFLKTNLVPHEQNKEALIRFLQLGSIPVPLTTIKNVFSLSCGHYIEITPDKFNLNKYWDLKNCFNNVEKISLSDAIENTRELLTDSIKSHLISDVPLGVFLSGGIDSSAVVALASQFVDKPLKTLSIIFEEEKYNEAQYSRLIAEKFNTNHSEILIKEDDFYNEIDNIFIAMDQPSIDGINTYFISKVAKEIGLKVVLSGIGGDEVFLGYKHYKYANYLQAFSHLPKWSKEFLINTFISLRTNDSINKLAYLKDRNSINAYLVFRGLFTEEEIQKLLGISKNEYLKYGSPFKNLNSFLEDSFIKSFDFLDFMHYLQNQILKDTDFMSMAHGVEVRVPFLDHFLASNVIQLDSNVKLKNGINKPFLINMLESDFPSEVWKRQKKGFTFPLDIWIKENYKDCESMIFNKNMHDLKALRNIWESFKNNRVHWSKIWALVVLNQFETKTQVLS